MVSAVGGQEKNGNLKQDCR